MPPAKNSPGNTVTVFRPRGLQRWLGILFSTVIGFMFPVAYLGYASSTKIKTSLFSDGNDGEATTALVAFLLFTALIWLVSYNLFQSVNGQLLAIGPGGIAYKRNRKYFILAKWDSLVAYGSTTYGVRTIDGYFARSEAIEKGKTPQTGHSKLAARKPDPYANLTFNNLIPLSFFSADWEKDKIGALIREYCPGLFEEDGQGKPIQGFLPSGLSQSPGAEIEPPGRTDLQASHHPGSIVLAVGMVLFSVLIVFFGFLVQSDRENVVRGQVTQSAAAYHLQMTSTTAARPETKLNEYKKSLPEVLPFSDGVLPFNNKTLSLSPIPTNRFKTFYAHAILYNPFDGSAGEWNYGYFVTSSAGQSYRFLINVNHSYSVYQIAGTGPNAKETRLASGKLIYINTNSGDANLLEVYETGDNLYFLITGNVAASVPLNTGDTYQVKLAYEANFTGQEPGNTALTYKDFMVRGVQA